MISFFLIVGATALRAPPARACSLFPVKTQFAKGIFDFVLETPERWNSRLKVPSIGLEFFSGIFYFFCTANTSNQLLEFRGILSRLFGHKYSLQSNNGKRVGNRFQISIPAAETPAHRTAEVYGLEFGVRNKTMIGEILGSGLPQVKVGHSVGFLFHIRSVNTNFGQNAQVNLCRETP